MVTGVWVETERYAPDELKNTLASPFDVRDSKQVFSQKGLPRGEMAALSVLTALTGEHPSDSTSLIELLDPTHAHGPLPCRTGHSPHLCHGQEVSLPAWANSEEIRERSDRLHVALRETGVRASGVRCALLCPHDLNQALGEDVSKLDVDLALFRSVATTLVEQWGTEGTFICGKIGNRKSYASRLGPGTIPLVESREISTYDVPRTGRLSFVLDADDSDPLVSMASLVGKHLREVIMEAIHRVATRIVGETRRPSGYNDPVTAEFLRKASAPLLRAGIPDTCLRRKR